MLDMRVTIPPLTFIKIFLRGVMDLSFVKEIMSASEKVSIGERMGIKTQNGIVTYFEKISDSEVVVLTAYNVGQETMPIGKRAEALMGVLLSKLD